MVAQADSLLVVGKLLDVEVIMGCLRHVDAYSCLVFHLGFVQLQGGGGGKVYVLLAPAYEGRAVRRPLVQVESRGMQAQFSIVEGVVFRVRIAQIYPFMSQFPVFEGGAYRSFLHRILG